MHTCMYVCMFPLIDLARLYAWKWVPNISVENKTQCMLERIFQANQQNKMYAGKSIPEEKKSPKQNTVCWKVYSRNKSATTTMYAGKSIPEQKLSVCWKTYSRTTKQKQVWTLHLIMNFLFCFGREQPLLCIRKISPWSRQIPYPWQGPLRRHRFARS